MSESQDRKIIEGLLQLKDKEEAIAWLQRGQVRHNVGELSHEDSLTLVRHLYGLGAVEVIAVNIGVNAGLASTDNLIITLPDDDKKRESIFSWNNERVHFMGIDPDIDRGQKHLLVWFD